LITKTDCKIINLDCNDIQINALNVKVNNQFIEKDYLVLTDEFRSGINGGKFLQILLKTTYPADTQIIIETIYEISNVNNAVSFMDKEQTSSKMYKFA